MVEVAAVARTVLLRSIIFLFFDKFIKKMDNAKSEKNGHPTRNKFKSDDF